MVVIDEVAGQLLTFLFLPVHFGNLFLGTLSSASSTFGSPSLSGSWNALRAGLESWPTT